MLIGFTGRIGSGKDTAGQRFANMIDLPSQRISFAAKLKESAAVLLDVPVENFEEWKNDPDALIHLSVGRTAGMISGYEYDEPNVIREFTVREYLQRYGTESHRGVFGQNFWVEQALSGIDASHDTLYYVTDVRFDNEANGILDRGGKVFGVVGPNENEAVAHASEAGISPAFIEYTIKNDARDDQFRKLDTELHYLANFLGLPLKASEFA